MTDVVGPRETGYYYPEPYWLAREDGWIKSLLLFFDELAILLPDYMRGRHIQIDPTLAGPLDDRGLLRILEPEWFVDEAAATKLTQLVESLVKAGAFDSLEGGRFAELSMSRMASAKMFPTVDTIYQSLAERGLARPTEDGVSIPMHPAVRTTYLLLLAQLARETGARHGLDLHPVAGSPRTVESFSQFLELDPMPSRGHVVEFDLEVLSVDLERVPLDEVLDFREQNREAHRRYMSDLRSFALDLSLLGQVDRKRALSARKQELQEEAAELRQRSLKAFRSTKSVTSFAIGLTGAAWSFASGNPVPAILATLGAGLNMLPNGATGNAYSYVVKAQREL